MPVRLLQNWSNKLAGQLYDGNDQEWLVGQGAADRNIYLASDFGSYYRTGGRLATINAATEQAAEVALNFNTSPRTVIGNNTLFPTGSATAGSTQYNCYSVIYLPDGGKSIILDFTGARTVAATETTMTAASPMNVSVGLAPPPWNPARAYVPGDQVTGNMTQATGRTGNPFYKCVTANTNSEPTPGNANWTAGDDPTRIQCTLNGQQACGSKTVTLSDGTTTVTEGVWSTDPVSVPGAENSGAFIAVRTWVQNGGGVAFSNGQGYGSGTFMISGATSADVSGSGFPASGVPSQIGGTAVIRPAMVRGVPAAPGAGKSVVIIGDSIGAGTMCGSSATAMALVAGGSGFTNNDIGRRFAIDNTGGTATSCAVPAIGIITNVAAGAVTGVRLWHPGSYANSGLPSGTQGTSNYTQALADILGAAPTVMDGTGLTVSITISGSNGGFDQTLLNYAQGFIMRGLSGAGVRAANISSPGDTLEGWISRSQTRLALIARGSPSTAICELGINSITGGASLATMQANYARVWGFLRSLGCAIFQTTILPFPSSTDGFATLANQTAGAQDAVRQAVNAWIRGGAGGLLDGFIDAASVIEDGAAASPSGKVIVNGTIGYALIDGKHPTPPILPLLGSYVQANAYRLL
jgi:hypothetical protein